MNHCELAAVGARLEEAASNIWDATEESTYLELIQLYEQMAIEVLDSCDLSLEIAEAYLHGYLSGMRNAFKIKESEMD